MPAELRMSQTRGQRKNKRTVGVPASPFRDAPDDLRPSARPPLLKAPPLHQCSPEGQPVAHRPLGDIQHLNVALVPSKVSNSVALLLVSF